MTNEDVFRYRDIGLDCGVVGRAPYERLIKPQLFDPDWLGDQAVSVGAGGRGSAWFVKYQSQRWVLRHYRRGGFVARFNRDLYFYTGEQGTRSVHEFSLLKQMMGCGLPVPPPVAAFYKKVGRLWYRAAIIVEELQDSRTFADYLGEDDFPLWAEVGRTIARFHEAGVEHADLNCHNILITPSGPHLIDFDKGKVHSSSPADASWKQSNLSRLQRSIEKLSVLNIQRWEALLEGYRRG